MSEQNLLQSFLSQFQATADLMLKTFGHPAQIIEILLSRGWILDQLPPDYLVSIGETEKAWAELRESLEALQSETEALLKALEEGNILRVIEIIDSLGDLFARLEAAAMQLLEVLKFPLPAVPDEAELKVIVRALADDLLQHFVLTWLFQRRPILAQLLILPPCRAIVLACGAEICSTGTEKQTGSVLLRISVERPVLDLSHLKELLEDLRNGDWNPWKTFWNKLGKVSEVDAPVFAEDVFTPPRELLTFLGARTFVSSDIPSEHQKLMGDSESLKPLALSVGYCPEILGLSIDDADAGNYTWEGTSVQLVPGYAKIASDEKAAPAVELHFHQLRSRSWAVGPRTFALKVSKDTPALIVREASVNLSGNLSPDFEIRCSSTGPGLRLGSRCGTFLRVERTDISLAVDSVQSGVGSLQARLDLGRCGLTLDEDLALGLLRPLFPKGIQLGARLAFAWSNQTGWTVECQDGYATGGTLSIPQRVVLGPLTLERLRVGVRKQDNPLGIELFACTDATLNLKVASLTLGGVGLSTVLDFPPEGGNLWGARLRLKPTTPDRIALAIDAGVVKGLGELARDAGRDLFQGRLVLDLSGLTLSAVCLLSTSLPGGKKGYSLLAMLNVTFRPPIQLGYGFTLNAIGGMLGLHRKSHTAALQDGVRDGSLARALFPTDPLADVPQLLSDLERFFPATEGRYLFGPMVTLGWGTPTFITATLLLLLDLPSPVKLTAIGTLRACLPDKDHALIKLDLTALGVLDFERKEVSLDASLIRGSKLGGYGLSGDMALRSSWGRQPGFALSFGGFHSAFTPPAGFPSLKRVTVSLVDTSCVRVRLQAFLALTSSTLQLGARADLYAAFEVLSNRVSAEGNAGFETLFQFSPFQMQASLSASVAVCWNGDPLLSAKVRGSLSGPTPWKIDASATAEAFGCEFEVAFRKTLSGGSAASLQAVNPLSALLAALKADSSWSVMMPSSQRDPVHWEAPKLEEGLVAHPTATLVIQQRLLPLKTDLQCFGHAPLAAGATRYEVTSVSVGSGATSLSDAHELFARSSYQILSETEKLSGAEFEQKPGGVRIKNSGLNAGAPVTARFDQTIVLIDEQEPKPKFKPGRGLLLALAALSARARQARAAGSAGRFSNSTGMSAAGVQEAK